MTVVEAALLGAVIGNVIGLAIVFVAGLCLLKVFS